MNNISIVQAVTGQQYKVDDEQNDQTVGHLVWN